MMDIFRLTEMEISAIKLSLLVATTAVVVSTPFGILFGWLLARKDFYGKKAVDALLHLPLVIPPIVTGYILLLLFGKKGVFGAPLYDIFGLTFAFNWKGAALASAVVAFPLMVRSIRISISAVDIGYEQAAKTLGRTPLNLFFTITLPLALPGVIGGIILAFARSIGEFGATITFVSNIPGETSTLPLAMYTLLQTPGGEASTARLGVIAVLIGFGAMVLSEYFANSKLRRK